MKPQPYLSKNGKSIFNEIAEHLKHNGIIDVDSFKLSVLSDCFDMYAVSCDKINKEGVSNKHGQVSPWLSAKDKALNGISKFSPGFGIDPASREKIKGFEKKEEGINFD